MRRQNSGQRHEQDSSATPWVPIIAVLSIMVTGCVSTLMALELDAFRPAVGDVVVFRPASADSDAWELDVPATKVVSPNIKAGTCMLNPNVMAIAGGSIVVEARRETDPPLYRLHWAGGHTDKTATDCGTSAELTVTRVNLQKLANSAGGFGFDRDISP